jgi:hypothetical protein
MVGNCQHWEHWVGERTRSGAAGGKAKGKGLWLLQVLRFLELLGRRE